MSDTFLDRIEVILGRKRLNEERGKNESEMVHSRSVETEQTHLLHHYPRNEMLLESFDLVLFFYPLEASLGTFSRLSMLLDLLAFVLFVDVRSRTLYLLSMQNIGRPC